MRLPELNSHIDRYGLAKIILPAFLFMQPFARFAAVKSALFVILSVIFAVRIAGGRTRVDFRDRSVIAFLLLFAVSFVSSAVSPYALESLDAMRKNMLYVSVLFFMILSEYRGFDDLKPLFYATIAGFSLLSLVIALKYNAELFNWIAYVEKTGDRDRLLGGYSTFAAFYVPFAAAYLMSSKERPWIRWTIVFFVFLEFVLSVLNNHRTQLAAIAASLAVMTLLAGRYRVFAVGLAAALIASILITQIRPGSFERYETLMRSETYVTNTGLSDRLSIWKGALDMIKERPVIGWGYGWKKIAVVAKEQGFLERWDSGGATFRYFSKAGYGAANPHNLALQILFEVGATGLASFIFFWLTILVKSARTYKRHWGRGPGVPPAPPAALFLKYGVIGVLVSYALLNATNGYWHEAFGNLIFSFSAVSIVLYKEATGPPKEAAGPPNVPA